jgi:hypothetical protein
MTEEEMKQLLTEMFGEFKQSIISEVNTTNGKFAAALERKFKKEEPAPTEVADAADENPAAPKLSLKALQQQIQDLTTQLSEKEQAALRADKTAAISQLIAGSPAQNKATLQKLFSIEYGDKLQKENGQWFLEQGGQVQSLQDCLNGYLNSDEGKIFLPPTETQGSGSSRSSKAAMNSVGTELSLDEKYAAITQNYASAFSG